MGRYFVAVVPEGANRNAELKRLAGKLKRTVNDRERESRWISSDLWHVTLQFLGEVGEAQLPALEALLREWRPQTGSLHLKLQGLGAFPSVEAARVLWIGIAQTQALLDLQADLTTRLKTSGFTIDDRAYQPHLSLVRFRNPTSAEDLVGLGRKKFFGDYRVEEWILFESFVQGHMSRYVARARGRLGSDVMS